MSVTKEFRRNRIRMRIRRIVSGTAQRPRLSVYRSNKDIYVQLVDDLSGKTLASASSRDKDFAAKGQKINKTEQAKQVGTAIAKKAVAANITAVTFDRGGYLYHGRVKALADAAREAGLQF
ncbi:MAG: large subunit ribosomal protein L18 [Bacteroidetes bacterium]|nr:MAG: large subunit ribosomal protein L18 [Bacteroidota bacterium]